MSEHNAQEEVLCVHVEEDGESRLDVALTRALKAASTRADGTITAAERIPTRSKISQWITEGRVRVDGRVVRKASFRVLPGASLEVALPQPKALTVEPDPGVALDIRYEDSDVLVVNKPPGVVVHPGAGHSEKTLVHGLLAYLGEDLRLVGDALRPGIVHRLDKETSGLLVIAKNDLAQQSLIAQFRPPRTIRRTYLALAARAPRAELEHASGEGVIRLPIGRHPRRRKEMAVVSEGKEAETSWKLVEAYRYGVLLELRLATGRTHQIRVHLREANAPILGDPLYGAQRLNGPSAVNGAIARLGRQALHASRLEFLQPRSGTPVQVEAELPSDMQELQRVLRAESRR